MNHRCKNCLDSFLFSKITLCVVKVCNNMLFVQSCPFSAHISAGFGTSGATSVQHSIIECVLDTQHTCDIIMQGFSKWRILRTAFYLCELFAGCDDSQLRYNSSGYFDMSFDIPQIVLCRLCTRWLSDCSLHIFAQKSIVNACSAKTENIKMLGTRLREIILKPWTLSWSFMDFFFKIMNF